MTYIKDITILSCGMSIIIDVETTGLPVRNRDYKDTTAYENARIVQFTMMLCDHKFQQIELKDFIIKRSGFAIGNSHIHGITDEISDEKGVDIKEAIQVLSDYLKQVDMIIAHNADFDINVIKAELYRNPCYSDIITAMDSKEVVCTMKRTSKFVNIKGKYGIKYPSLAELYLHLFNEPLENAHNSMYDVINLHKIVIELHHKNLCF